MKRVGGMLFKRFLDVRIIGAQIQSAPVLESAVYSDRFNLHDNKKIRLQNTLFSYKYTR